MLTNQLPPDSSSQLVHPTHGALKTRSCSGLHLLIAHVLEVIDSWIVLTWSLKNEELFQITLEGHPFVNSYSGLDTWIVHAWQVLDLWVVLAWSLINRELVQTPTPFFFSFCDAVGLLNWFWCFYLKRPRELVSPVCRIFSLANKHE